MNIRSEPIGINRNYLFVDHASLSPPEDPWGIPVDLTEGCTLGELLEKDFIGVTALHILTHNKDAAYSDFVRYRYLYRGSGVKNVWDVEWNGLLFRHFRDRIYRKRVGQ